MHAENERIGLTERDIVTYAACIMELVVNS